MILDYNNGNIIINHNGFESIMEPSMVHFTKTFDGEKYTVVFPLLPPSERIGCSGFNAYIEEIYGEITITIDGFHWTYMDGLVLSESFTDWCKRFSGEVDRKYNEEFGHPVSISEDGNTLTIGPKDSVEYTYTRSGDSWECVGRKINTNH